MKPEISVLIVIYRRYDHYEKCVSSLNMKTNAPYQLCVRDNTYENLGFSKAVNLLVRQAVGKYVVLLNPDTVVATGDWLKPMVELFEKDKRIGIVQPKMLLMDGKTVDSTGHEYNRGLLGTIRFWDRMYDTGTYDELASCCFGAAVIRREVFEEIGLLDEHCFLYYEDVDFCLRARKKGWKIYYCPDSTVLHARHGSGFVKYDYWPYILRKHFGTKMWARAIIVSLIGVAIGLKRKQLDYFRMKLLSIVRSV